MDDPYQTHTHYKHHGVPSRYESYFTPAVGSALLHYFMHVDKLSMDAALAKIDAMDKYIREYTA